MRCFILGLALGLLAGITPVVSQEIPQSLQEGGPDDVIRQRQNYWTVSIVAGSKNSTSLRFVDELARILDDGHELRVLPIISRGAAGNVEDLLYLRDVDVAFTQSDAVEYFRTERKTALGNRVQYIARLPDAELHVAAGIDIRTLDDLRGKKVVFGQPGSSASLTGPILFRRLGIPVTPVFIDPLAGVDLVASGGASALLAVESKPNDFWTHIRPDSGLHLVPVPCAKALADLYVPSAFTDADYPNLLGPGQKAETIAVATELAVQNWPKDSDSFRRVTRFVQYLFARWDRLTEPPFHPSWRGVNLAAAVPGWTRFSASENVLQHLAQSDQAIGGDLQIFLRQQVHTMPRNEAEWNALFPRFMMWREQQRRK